MSLSAIIYCFPRFFEVIPFKVILCYDPRNPFFVPSGRPHRLDPYYKWIYILFFHCIQLFALPFLVVLILNILVYISIRRAYNRREAMSLKTKREISTTLMLFAEAVVFLVCNTPSLFLNYMETSHMYWIHEVCFIRFFVI